MTLQWSRNVTRHRSLILQVTQRSWITWKTWVLNIFDHLPTTSHKKGLPLSLSATNRPRMPSVCCPTIDRAFINKNKLTCIVLTNPCNIFKSLLSWTLCHNMGELSNRLVSAILVFGCPMTHLLQCKPSWPQSTPNCWLRCFYTTRYRQHLL